MPYRDYVEDRSHLMIRSSAPESHASGLAVGRLEVWPPRSARGKDVIRLIDDSGFDVVIVRMSAEDFELSAALHSDKFVSWQADTLLYFSVAAESLASEAAPDALVKMTLSDERDADVLVERIFANYRNHYSANPALSRINVVTAYQDWTRASLGGAENAVYKALDTNGAATGLCVIDIDDESYDEVLLAGIVPEKRGQGEYQRVMKMVGARAQAASKEAVVISTQAANVAVMRSWCRLGFLPIITLNTVHVVRRNIVDVALGEN